MPSRNSDRTLNTVWNDVAPANYGQSKDIAAANVWRKQFGKLWFLSCNQLEKTDTVYKPSRHYKAARFRPLMVNIFNQI